SQRFLGCQRAIQHAKIQRRQATLVTCESRVGQQLRGQTGCRFIQERTVKQEQCLRGDGGRRTVAGVLGGLREIEEVQRVGRTALLRRTDNGQVNGSQPGLVVAEAVQR